MHLGIYVEGLSSLLYRQIRRRSSGVKLISRRIRVLIELVHSTGERQQRIHIVGIARPNEASRRVGIDQHLRRLEDALDLRVGNSGVGGTV